MTSPLQTAFDAFDQLNSKDPNTITVNGQAIAKELLYAQRMSDKLQQFIPESSIALQLAARSQHIQRWKILRSDYAAGPQAYKKWRTDLGKFHAETATQILMKLNFEPSIIEKVECLLLKKGIKSDSEVQALEDVICLVFLEFYLEDFAHKHSEEKLISIIQKTWQKMSDKGHDAALKLPFNEAMLTLVQKALS